MTLKHLRRLVIVPLHSLETALGSAGGSVIGIEQVSAELIIVFIVAIIVFGPERLPTLARQLGRLYKKAQDFFDATQKEIARQTKFAMLEENEKKAEKADEHYQNLSTQQKNPSEHA